MMEKSYRKVYGIGFYFLIPAFVLCLIAPFVHMAGFQGTEYFAPSALWVPIVGTMVCALLAVYKKTTRYATVLTFFMSLTSLLTFLAVAYMHLSSAFFNGVGETLGEILKQAGFNFSFCTIAYAIALLSSIVAMFLPTGKRKEVIL